jgi:hypothetical protein
MDPRSENPDLGHPIQFPTREPTLPAWMGFAKMGFHRVAFDFENGRFGWD